MDCISNKTIIFILFLVVILSFPTVSAGDLIQTIETDSFNDFQKVVNESTSNEINVEKDYTYREGDNPIIINKSVVINGNNHTFNALNQSSIFIIESDNVIIKNINLINANAGFSEPQSYSPFLSLHYVTVDDSGSFSDFYASEYLKSDRGGGAINCRANNFKISDSRFDNNYAPIGGSIYIDGNNSTVQNCIFRLNNAIVGSAIYQNAGYVIISDSKFLRGTTLID